MEIKIDKKGRVTIPKELRDKYNLTEGIKVYFYDGQEYGGILLKPVASCSACKKALSEQLYERGACLGCKPPVRIFIY